MSRTGRRRTVAARAPSASSVASCEALTRERRGDNTRRLLRGLFELRQAQFTVPGYDLIHQRPAAGISDTQQYPEFQGLICPEPEQSHAG